MLIVLLYKSTTIHTHTTVVMCRTGKKVKEFKWIQEVFDHVEQLSGYDEVVKVFLKLKDSLILSKDFQLSQVHAAVWVRTRILAHLMYHMQSECHCSTGH